MTFGKPENTANRVLPPIPKVSLERLAILSQLHRTAQRSLRLAELVGMKRGQGFFKMLGEMEAKGLITGTLNAHAGKASKLWTITEKGYDLFREAMAFADACKRSCR